MKYLVQFLIILLFSFLGEGLHYLLPWPIPASIYGMVLLFLALCLKIIDLEWVRDTGHFLVNIMAVMFVSPAVGLLNCWDVVSRHFWSVCVIIFVSLVVVFGVSGRVTQWLLQRKEEDGNA